MTLIARTPWIDDDGTGTTGTAIDNYEKQKLYGEIDTASGGAFSYFDPVGIGGRPSFNFGNRATLPSYFNIANVKVLEDSTSAKIYIISGADVFDQGAFLALMHARGTLVAPTATQNGDVLGSVVYEGYFGTMATPGDAFNHGVELTAFATETWDATHQGTRLEIRTTKAGAPLQNPGNRLIIDTPYIESKEKFILPTGTVAAPALTFSGNTATGIYAPTTGAVAFSGNGVLLGLFAEGVGNGLYVGYAETTANPANVWMAAGAGYLKTSTSLRAAKTALTPIPVEVARATVMGLEAITYQSACPYDDHDRTWPGLVAEDVEAVTPSLVVYGDGHALQSVAYDRVPCYLVPLAQDHERRLQALERRVP